MDEIQQPSVFFSQVPVELGGPHIKNPTKKDRKMIFSVFFIFINYAAVLTAVICVFTPSYQ